MNRFGSRLSSTSTAGSQSSVSLSTMRGSRSYQLTSACISVNESPGPACRQKTSSGAPGMGVRGRAHGLDLQPQHPPRLPEEHHEEGQHDVVVDPLEARRADPPAEAGADPEPEQLDQRDALQRQVHQRPPRAAAAAAAGPGTNGESSPAPTQPERHVVHTARSARSPAARPRAAGAPADRAASEVLLQVGHARAVRRLDPAGHRGGVR